MDKIIKQTFLGYGENFSYSVSKNQWASGKIDYTICHDGGGGFCFSRIDYRDVCPTIAVTAQEARDRIKAKQEAK